MANDPDPGKGRPRRGLTRRSLMKTAGIAAASGALMRPAGVLAQDAQTSVDAIGPGPAPVTLTLNGKKKKLRVEPRRTLLDAIRGDVGLTGAKRVCDRGTCGACTIWLDGRPVYSCMVLAVEAEGHEITTVEGLGTPENMHPVQQAFCEADALQCGFCTPGLVMTCAHAVEQHGKALTREKLVAAASGNLCRCGTYAHVIDAALLAAKRAGK